MSAALLRRCELPLRNAEITHWALDINHYFEHKTLCLAGSVCTRGSSLRRDGWKIKMTALILKFPWSTSFKWKLSMVYHSYFICFGCRSFLENKSIKKLTVQTDPFLLDAIRDTSSILSSSASMLVRTSELCLHNIHWKKGYRFSRMSLTKLSLAGNDLIIPGQGEFGTWHPGWGWENR